MESVRRVRFLGLCSKLRFFLRSERRNGGGPGRLGMRFADADHELIGNFDAHGFFSAAQGKAVLQEDGVSRIGYECAHRREVNIGRAIVRFHALAYQR